MQFALLELGAFIHRGVDFGDGHRRVHRADVDHGLALLAVQVRHARHRLCAVELENEGEILEEGLLGERPVLPVAEGHALPVLPLVLAEIQNIEGLAVLDAEQSLTGDVDAPAAEVAADPATSKLLGDGQGRTRAEEEIRND